MLAWLAASGLALLFLTVYTLVYGAQSTSKPIIAYRRLIWDNGLRTAGYAAPLAYLGVYIFCLYLFRLYCMDRITSLVHRAIIWFLASLPAIAISAATLADPGKITATNHQSMMSMYPFDRILFTPHKECGTCKFEKPARSRHCSVCQACVAVADHHCIWINNCVGIKNYKYFMFFLVSNLIVYVYGFILLMPIIKDRVRALWKYTHNPWNLVTGTIGYSDEHRVASCLLILCVAIGAITLSFLVWTLKLVYQGTTTNESDKWTDVEYLFQEGALYTFKFELERDSLPCIVLQKLRNENGQGTVWNRRLTDEERRIIEVHHGKLCRVDSYDDIKNIYDQGFWRNLRILCGLYQP